MVTIKYIEYHNDRYMPDKTECFSTLKQLQDWIFDQQKGSYDYGLWFTDPDKKKVEDLHWNGSIASFNRDTHVTYWVNTIIVDGGIIYSDGRNTGGIKHWNETAKQFLRDCIARKNNPASGYNFV